MKGLMSFIFSFISLWSLYSNIESINHQDIYKAHEVIQANKHLLESQTATEDSIDYLSKQLSISIRSLCDVGDITLENEIQKNSTEFLKLLPNSTHNMDANLSLSQPPLFDYFYLNEHNLPFVISVNDPTATLSELTEWVKSHKNELQNTLNICGAILLRNFPIANPNDFSTIVEEMLDNKSMIYTGEGSRNKVTDRVYTSTEAPPQFHIPLHNELSCTNHPLRYICFYCEVAPEKNMGQTILGKTEHISENIKKHSAVWDFFEGQNIKYISRHPPEGSFYSLVNVTHKTWQKVFETNDKEEVARICNEKGYEFRFLDNWVEVTRIAPAIKGPDEFFDHPYWFNQCYLYHSNPIIRGGWANHLMAELLYIIPSTRQYDVELENGTPIPKELVYQIYDVLNKKTIKFDWETNDILILDNIKVLHGRAPYQGQRRILVLMIP